MYVFPAKCGFKGKDGRVFGDCEKIDSFLFTFSDGYRILSWLLKTHELYNPDMVRPVPILGSYLKSVPSKDKPFTPSLGPFHPIYLLPFFEKRFKEKAGIRTFPPGPLFLNCKSSFLLAWSEKKRNPQSFCRNRLASWGDPGVGFKETV